MGRGSGWGALEAEADDDADAHAVEDSIVVDKGMEELSDDEVETGHGE